MGKLIYFMSSSLDGRVADADGNFDWSEPDEESHRFVNDLFRPVGTHLSGRREHEIMTFWETADADPSEPEVFLDFARIWKAADKVVYSRTLQEVTTTRTRLEREFDPNAVRALVAASDPDVSIAGPTLAARALRAGLVDEIHTYLVPVIVGSGLRFLPDDVRLDLELLAQHTFANGTIYLRYARR
jgi:dihydrofolate reductase